MLFKLVVASEADKDEGEEEFFFRKIEISILFVSFHQVMGSCYLFEKNFKIISFLLNSLNCHVSLFIQSIELLLDNQLWRIESIMCNFLSVIFPQHPCSNQHIKCIIYSSSNIFLIFVNVRPLEVKRVQPILKTFFLQPIDQLCGHVLVGRGSTFNDHIADFDRKIFEASGWSGGRHDSLKVEFPLTGRHSFLHLVKSSVFLFIDSKQICSQAAGLSDNAAYFVWSVGVFLVFLFEIVFWELVVVEFESSAFPTKQCFFFLGRNHEIFWEGILLLRLIAFEVRVIVYFRVIVLHSILIAVLKIVKVVSAVKHGGVHKSFGLLIYALVGF